MKKLILPLIMLCSAPAFAEGNLIEFNLSQSTVTYQLNRINGSLFAIIKDTPGGICLHKMDLKTKANSDTVFVYERNNTDRGRNYYQRFELNLISNQVNLFTSARNRTSIIPIEKRDCSVNSCTNISNIPQCSY
jgi:hypothetical protein